MKALLSLVLATFMLASIGCGQSGEKAAAVKVDDAKKLNFTYKTTTGETVDARQYYGKVVLVDIWDTWCGPCRKGIPHLMDIYKQYEGKVEVVGLAFGREGAPKVQAFADQMKINYPVGIFSDEAAKIFGSPRSIPTLFIIGKDGEIVETVVGYRPKEFFDQKIQALL
ncbi:MAG: TlpA family protein disulfide reductase [bacterium]|nr:TlpA family protein disulfide reductase [bacterium]